MNITIVPAIKGEYYQVYFRAGSVSTSVMFNRNDLLKLDVCIHNALKVNDVVTIDELPF